MRDYPTSATASEVGMQGPTRMPSRPTGTRQLSVIVTTRLRGRITPIVRLVERSGIYYRSERGPVDEPGGKPLW
jgi:hypothetical protein